VGGLGLLETVDAVVFGLGDAEEGAVAKFAREGDAVGGVGKGFEIGGEERAVVVGFGVMVEVGEVTAGDRDNGAPFGPGLGDGRADVGPRAFDGFAFGDLQDFFKRGFALVFKDQVVVRTGLNEGGVDDVVAGVEEDFGGGQGFEVGGGGVEDAVIEAGVAGVIAGEASGDGGGPQMSQRLWSGS